MYIHLSTPIYTFVYVQKTFLHMYMYIYIYIRMYMYMYVFSYRYMGTNCLHRDAAQRLGEASTAPSAARSSKASPLGPAVRRPPGAGPGYVLGMAQVAYIKGI